MAKPNKYGGINDMRGWGNKSTDSNYNSFYHIIYGMWRSMLQRVHDREMFPTYEGCTIDNDWYYLSKFYRDLQTIPGYKEFKEANGKGFCLDKDIKVKGNRHYGKNTCLLVTKSENVKESNHRVRRRLRRVMRVNIEDPFDYVVYDTMKDSEKEGFSVPSIVVCCQGGRQKTHKGYYWYYI